MIMTRQADDKLMSLTGRPAQSPSHAPELPAALPHPTQQWLVPQAPALPDICCHDVDHVSHGLTLLGFQTSQMHRFS
jgi:hypothetical protein